MNSCIQVFNESSKFEYLTLLNDLNLNLDIYYYPCFLEWDAKIQGGAYEIFFYRKEEEVFIYPYIKLSFVDKKFENYFDISSPYGYCGPFSTSKFIFVEAEVEFMHFIKDKCITEFVRYHYVYNDKRKFLRQIQNSKNRTIVTLDLSLDWDVIWTKEFSVKNRNLIRKLDKEGFDYVSTKKSDDLHGFIEMYYSTMKNVEASNFYFFKKDLLNQLFEIFGENLILVKVESNKVVYAYALFFISGGIATYFLSARNLDFPKVPATNFLLGKSAEILKKNGVQIINFGGGMFNKVDDYLLKFKQNFSSETKEYFIGKRIFNQEIYNQIVNDWIEVYGKVDYENRKNILQFYR